MAKNMCRILVDRLLETSFCVVNKSRDAGGGHSREGTPIHFNQLYNRSVLALSFSAVMPHYEETAYISRTIVVALVTECIASSGRPWALSTRMANIEREQTEARFST